jgi:hypothetical protein
MRAGKRMMAVVIGLCLIGFVGEARAPGHDGWEGIGLVRRASRMRAEERPASQVWHLPDAGTATASLKRSGVAAQLICMILTLSLPKQEQSELQVAAPGRNAR